MTELNQLGHTLENTTGVNRVITEISRIHELDQIQQQKLLEFLSITSPSDFVIENITKNGPIDPEYFLKMSNHDQLYTRFGLFDKNSQDSERDVLTSIFTYHGFLAYCVHDGMSATDTINHIGGKDYFVFDNNDIKIDDELQKQIKSRINLTSLRSAYKIIKNPKYILTEEEQKNFDNIITSITYIKFKKAIEAISEDIIDIDTTP